MAHRLEEDINRVVKNIMEDYEQGRDVDLVEDFLHPNMDEIVKILKQIRNIIFPGYYKNRSYRIYTIRNNLSMQLEDVVYNLSRQIAIVPRYLSEYDMKEEKELLYEGEQITLKFFGIE